LPGQVWWLCRYIGREDVRVINVHYPDLDALSWLLPRWIMRTRVVLSFHGTDARQATRSGPLQRRAWRFLLEHVDRIVVCSESLIPSLRELGCSKERIAVISNGVAPDAIERYADRVAPVALPQRYIASLASFEAKKGLDVLMRAFDRIAASDPTLHLVLAGRLADRTVFSELSRTRADLGAGERITLLPDLAHEEAIAVLQRAEIFALPSRIEPFGIAILEAGVLRKPVIATAACGVVHFLNPDSELIVVPTGDESALAEALCRLLAAPEYARGLGERLRMRVLDEFTWPRIAGNYAPVFGLRKRRGGILSPHEPLAANSR
jgi:glycosyltransferase involved in cell wall biosynthesis